MTTREATSLLSRSHETGFAKDVADWAWVIAFGAIGWPWLLKSLYGGRKADKRALLDRLDLPHDALPHLGSWKADVGLLTLVTDHVFKTRPKTVVEFGTGASTLIIARALQQAGVDARYVSLDQHADFSQKTGEWLAEYGLEADLRAAPLKPPPGDWPGLWYDSGPLPDRIDFMLIDGPNWAIHPFTRGAAASLFGRIPVGGVVMLDDAARPGERIVARRWRKLWPNFRFDLVKSGTKGTLVGTRLY